LQDRFLKVALVVSGFPDPSEASRGIFNLRTAKAIGELTELRVIFLRTWKPKRKLVNVSEYRGTPVTMVALPQLPASLSTAFTINLALYRSLGWRLLHSLLRTFDLIHSVDLLPGIVASHWARCARIHHVYQATGGDVNTILPKIRSARIIAGWETHVHGVASVSRTLESSFRSIYPHVQNIRTAYRGVNLEHFQPRGSAVGPLANRPPVRYLFLGGYPAYPTQPYRSNTKGGETLLDVWKAAEDELIAANASLLIAGPETNSDFLTRWRANLRHPDRVFIQGSISPDIIPQYIRSADVVLLPSMQEGLPSVAMEASACARPVFGSRIGGIPEVVMHEKTGLLLPAGDLGAWKRALIHYASEPDLLQVMGKRARQRMELVFDSKNYAPQILDLYHAALRHPFD